MWRRENNLKCWGEIWGEILQQISKIFVCIPFIFDNAKHSCHISDARFGFRFANHLLENKFSVPSPLHHMEWIKIDIFLFTHASHLPHSNIDLFLLWLRDSRKFLVLRSIDEIFPKAFLFRCGSPCLTFSRSSFSLFSMHLLMPSKREIFSFSMRAKEKRSSSLLS